MQGDDIYQDEVDSATRRRYARVRRFTPRWSTCTAVFEHQAGAMANLADEAVTVLYTTMSFRDVVAFHSRKRGRNARPPLRRQDVPIMRQILRRRIRNTALSDADVYLRQLTEIEAMVEASSPRS